MRTYNVLCGLDKGVSVKVRKSLLLELVGSGLVQLELKISPLRNWSSSKTACSQWLSSRVAGRGFGLKMTVALAVSELANK